MDSLARQTVGRTLAAALLLASLGVSAGCSPRVGGELPPPTVEMPERSERVSVYFSTGRSLTQEYRVVDANDLYASTIAELVAALPETPDIAIVQPEAEVLSVVVEDGTATIDWDRAVLDFEADPEEYRLAWGAFLLTLGQFPEVERVMFTVEGQTSGSIEGKDIETFWGEVTLANQPWDVTRPPGYEDPDASDEETATPEAETEDGE